MVTIAITLAALALIIPVAATAQSFDAQRVSQQIKELSDDAFSGRAPGTAGETKTVAYLIAQMQAAGLQPGGPVTGTTRGWTQDVPLFQADIVGTPVVTLATSGTTRALTRGQEIALRATLTGQAGVAIKDAPMVFVGYGVKAPERRWDDFKGIDLKGKIMVVLVNDPDFEGGVGDFGGKAMTYYGRWTYKYEEAVRQGAAGVLVIHEAAAAAYGWSTVANTSAAAVFDTVRATSAAGHVPLEGWIRRDLAVDLFKAAGLDFDAAKQAARRRDFEPVPLRSTLSATYAVTTRKIVSTNVLGRLTGAHHPDETVLYCAHWDHLGVGQPDAHGDAIYNGAIDNASGTAMLLELARAFAAAPQTDRSLVFLAVTAEEKGLLGSKYYADNPVYPLAMTAGVINMDSTLGGGAARDFSISGTAKLGLLDLLVTDGAKLGRTYTPDPHPEAGEFYRSDHFSFAKAGVPAISFEPGLDLMKGGKERGQALADAYVRDRYHEATDNWSADWDLSSLVPDLTLLYATGHDLATTRAWPEWSLDSEFRAIRETSRAQRQP